MQGRIVEEEGPGLQPVAESEYSGFCISEGSSNARLAGSKGLDQLVPNVDGLDLGSAVRRHSFVLPRLKDHVQPCGHRAIGYPPIVFVFSSESDVHPGIVNERST
jgi:hypothetical protein